MHYFDRTGHSWAAPGEIERHFLDWMETVRDAISFIVQQPEVDAGRLGLLGFSLGAYLSLSLATQEDRIAAVAELFGGLPGHFAGNAANLPPVLILHGTLDPIVPVSEAKRLEELLQANHVPFEKKIYSGQGHTLNGLPQMDAVRRVVGFFRKYLFRAA